MGSIDSSLHLTRPLGASTAAVAPSTSSLSISLHPQTIYSIIDHSQRRPPSSPRVIGTLLGTRSEDGASVSISSSFAVGHTETTDQVEVDMEYQKQMLSLHLRANPKEVLVGWYATSSELNTFSALIQNFYGGQGEGTWPYPAVHLTVSTEPGKEIEVRTYISTSVGVTAERAADSAAFIPVPYEIKYSESEKSALETVGGAIGQDRVGKVLSDIENLETSIETVLGTLERVERYVEGVLDEEVAPSTALGQYLLNALALAPKVGVAEMEKNFNDHIQDVLVVSYLANTIRTQMDLSNRLATAQLTLGGPDGATAGPTDKEGGGGGGGGRGGRGGRSNRGQQRNRGGGESGSGGGGFGDA